MGMLESGMIVLGGVAAVVCVLLLRANRETARLPRRSALLRLTAGAALTAVASGLLYLQELRGGGPVTFALANAAMVFAPAMLLAAARRVNDRAAASALVPAASVSFLVLAATLFSPLLAGGLKVAALAVICTLLYAESSVRAMRVLPGGGLLAATAATYSLFTAGRLLVGLFAGTGSALWTTVFSTAVATVIGILSLVAVSVAVHRMARALAREAPAAAERPACSTARTTAERMLREHGGLVALTLSSPDSDLVRTAYGIGRAGSIARALEEAAASALPDALVGATRGRAFALLAPDTDLAACEESLRADFADLAPRIGVHDIPELRIARDKVTDPAQLEPFFAPPPPRWRDIFVARSAAA